MMYSQIGKNWGIYIVLDNLIGSQCQRVSSLVARVKFGAINERSGIMTFARAVEIGGFSFVM